tara:strand:- start:44947 stop:45729 length:783 start_codon:yes stop_codon:yes gene_type:complete
MVELYDELNNVGISFLRGGIDESLINELCESLNNSITKHRGIQIKNNNDIDIGGVALNVVGDSPTYIKLLERLISLGIISGMEKHFFKSKFILNSFSGLNNLPGKTNFSGEVHRDSKYFMKGDPLMLNILVMLDDFTEENGPTLLLPNSHKVVEKPSDEEFLTKSIKAIGKKGDILFFNADIWHSSSLNNTNEDRRALPLTFSKSFIKQLLDYPRYLGYDRKDEFSDELCGLLGYNSRVASNLDEWYLPYEDRFYKKNQD